jgi:hypothetical protein
MGSCQALSSAVEMGHWRSMGGEEYLCVPMKIHVMLNGVKHLSENR